MRRRAERSGQAMVEMMLILPVFLGIVFTIMEIGYISFRLIVLNHATYEAARVGGMIWKMPNGGAGAKMSALMAEMLPGSSTRGRGVPAATIQCQADNTLMDPQAQLQNMDLVCTGSEVIPLIFPISSILLAKPAGSGTRRLNATVRMPIEQPLPQ